MQHIATSVIVLKRINYSEADRIITALSRDGKKLKLMAKGVRKSTSKLAGGIELFSESEIHYIKGRNDIDTLISTRILHNYRNISSSLATARSGYELISVIDAIAEHSIEPRYYKLLKGYLDFLDRGINNEIILGMFYSNVLDISGHSLNLKKDTSGKVFNENYNYAYNFEMGAFEETPHGYSSAVIKILKLFCVKSPELLNKISGMNSELPNAINLLKSIVEYYLHYKYKN